MLSREREPFQGTPGVRKSWLEDPRGDWVIRQGEPAGGEEGGAAERNRAKRKDVI